MRMHIAFATIESPYEDGAGCGIAAYLRAIVPAIVEAGHQVTILANAKEEKTFLAENDRVTVHHLQLPSRHWYAAQVPALRGIAPLPLRQLEWSYTFHRHMAGVARYRKIDVIESTEVGSLLLHRLAPVVIRLHGSERIFREHSGLPLNVSIRCSDGLEARASRRAAAITAPSKFHAMKIAELRRWPLERVHVIANPVSQTILNAAANFQRNGHIERIVLYTGRLAPVKGIETLLEAARLVHSGDSSIRFVLAGPWQMPNSPESYGLENGHQGIRWVGMQNEQQLIDWYKRASVLVMPSNYETFGLSAIEGLAFGNAIVATQGTAITETLGESKLTSFVPSGDANALARMIERQFATPHKAYARQDIEAALAPFQPHRVAAETLKLYERLVGPPSTE